MLHELWQEHGEHPGFTFCLAGTRGEQSRSMLSDHAELVWTVEASSWLEAMTALYAHLDWGAYRSMDAELDAITYAQKGWE